MAINGKQIYEVYKMLVTKHDPDGARHLVTWPHVMPVGQTIMNELADWVNGGYRREEAREFLDIVATPPFYIPAQPLKMVTTGRSMTLTCQANPDGACYWQNCPVVNGPCPLQKHSIDKIITEGEDLT